MRPECTKLEADWQNGSAQDGNAVFGMVLVLTWYARGVAVIAFGVFMLWYLRWMLALAEGLK